MCGKGCECECGFVRRGMGEVGRGVEGSALTFLAGAAMMEEIDEREEKVLVLGLGGGCSLCFVCVECVGKVGRREEEEADDDDDAASNQAND